MKTIGKVVILTLGLIVVYDLLHLSSSKPGVLPGVAGTFGNLVNRFVSPSTPLIPYAPGFGPTAAQSFTTQVPATTPQQLVPATPQMLGGPLGAGLLLPKG